MAQKITPFLWYDGKAEEAAEFYVSIFKNSKIVSYMGQKGQAMGVTFQIDGQNYIAFNGGPHFKFTEAISLFVNAPTQEEIDELWEKLSAGGEKSRCGWLKDKYGLSWQIVPPVLGELLNDKDRDKANRVMQVMMGMGKLNIQELKDA
jgi:predicted 3-demethylubiquinone-9 3-methyltransferase (glyoxalase superfamily)